MTGSSADQVQVQIRADVAQYVAGMKQAASATGNAGAQMKAELADIGSAAKESHAPLAGFTSMLKDYRQEVRQESRYGKFLATEVANLGIASKGAAGELTMLVSALAFSGPMGAAVESVKLIVHAFQEAGAEMKKATADAVKGITDLKAKVDEYVATKKGETDAEKLARQELKPLEDQAIALRQQLVDQTDKQAAAENRLAQLRAAHVVLPTLTLEWQAISKQVLETEKLLKLTEAALALKKGPVATVEAEEDKEKLEQ